MYLARSLPLCPPPSLTSHHSAPLRRPTALLLCTICTTTLLYAVEVEVASPSPIARCCLCRLPAASCSPGSPHPCPSMRLLISLTHGLITHYMSSSHHPFIISSITSSSCPASSIHPSLHPLLHPPRPSSLVLARCLRRGVRASPTAPPPLLEGV